MVEILKEEGTSQSERERSQKTFTRKKELGANHRERDEAMAARKNTDWNQ